MDLPLQPQNSDPLVSLTRNVFNRGSVRKEVQRSPLRYPGGKSRAISSILALIPDNTDEICSPFFGGGSIELACARRGIHVFGSDLFEPLVNFWQCLLTNPSALADATVAYLPLPKARFYKLQKSYYSIPSALERAAVFFVLNRASYSGATLAGGMSPGHPRFTESSIQRVRSFHVDKVNVDHLDFRDAIAANPAHRLMYLDPPYMIASDIFMAIAAICTLALIILLLPNCCAKGPTGFFPTMIALRSGQSTATTEC